MHDRGCFSETDIGRPGAAKRTKVPAQMELRDTLHYSSLILVHETLHGVCHQSEVLGCLVAQDSQDLELEDSDNADGLAIRAQNCRRSRETNIHLIYSKSLLPASSTRLRIYAFFCRRRVRPIF